MATVYINVDEYFATISPLAKKISQDLDNVKESYGDDWNDFSCDQQDKELWNNLVPSEITDKYASQSSDEELRSVFPKLKIPCGEKIVVDFDNDDGWTWTDEHSGPFSWRSRSQQDLSLFDDEPEREMQKARNLKKTKHSKPPVTQTNQSQAFVEKNNWSSHFLASEKSTSHNVDPDTLEIFQRFGITFGGKEEEDASDALSIQVADEESSLLAGETDRDGLQLKLDTELLVDTDPSISEDTSEGTPDTIVVDTDMLVTSTVDSKPVSPTDAACYSRDMQSYQTYFTDAYNESSHQTAVTEQPKPVLRPPSPVTDTAVKHPRHVPASPVTAVTQPKPASPVTTVTQPKPASPVTTVTLPKPVPKPPSPVTQPKPVPKLEPVDPVKQPSDTSNTLVSLSLQSSDTSNTESDADTSYASKKSGFDFLDNW